MGILVKSFKKVFRRQIPFFLANLCFLIVPPPINLFLAETLHLCDSYLKGLGVQEYRIHLEFLSLYYKLVWKLYI